MPPIRAVLEARQNAAAVQLEDLRAKLEKLQRTVADAEEAL